MNIEFLDDEPERGELWTSFDRFLHAAGWFLAGIGFLAACIAAGIFFGGLR